MGTESSSAEPDATAAPAARDVDAAPEPPARDAAIGALGRSGRGHPAGLQGGRPPPPPSSVLALQRVAGNRAVTAYLARLPAVAPAAAQGPAETPVERARRIHYAFYGVTGLFSADVEAALDEIRGQRGEALAAMRTSYERLYGEYRLEDDFHAIGSAEQWQEARGWLRPALPLDARLRLSVGTQGEAGALLGFGVAGPVGSLIGGAIGRNVPTENERVMLATLAAWAQEAGEQERRVQAGNPKVIALLERSLSKDQLYEANKLLRPDDLEALVKERILGSYGVIDNAEQAVYDALLDLPPARRRSFWEAERRRGLFERLTDEQRASVERLCTGTLADVLQEGMTLATAGLGTAETGVTIAAAEVTRLRRELDEIRAMVAAGQPLTPERERRRQELEATLRKLLTVRRDASGALDADTFLGQFYGDVSAPEAERLAAEMGVDKLEQIRQRILAATSSLMVDTPAVLRALDDLAADPTLHARAGDLLADPVVAEAMKRLPVDVILASRAHERGDSYTIAVRRLRAALGAVNTDQAEVVRVLLGMGATDRARLRAGDSKEADLFTALTTHTSVADSDLGPIAAKILAAPEGEPPIRAVIDWALGATGDWAEPDALGAAFAEMKAADRHRYRLGYFLSRGGSLPSSRDEPTAIAERHEEAAARASFEALEALMRRSSLTQDQLQAALDELVGTATLAELTSERGTLLAAGIVQQRALDKGRQRSGEGSAATSRTIVDTLSESGPLADEAQARLEAFYHQAIADGQLTQEELLVVAALGKEFTAAYGAHVAATDQIASIASTAAAVAIGIVVGVATAGVGTPAAATALAAAGLGPAVLVGGGAAAVAKVGTAELVGGAHFDTLSQEGARLAAGAFVEGASNVLAAGLVARFSSFVGLGGPTLSEKLAAATIASGEAALAEIGESVSLVAARSAIEGFLSGVIGEMAVTALDEKIWRQSIWKVIEDLGAALLRGGAVGAATGAAFAGVLEALGASVGAARVQGLLSRLEGAGVGGRRLEDMSVGAVRALGEADAALAGGRVDDAARAIAGLGDELGAEELEQVWRTLGRHHLGADPPSLGAAPTGGVRGRNVYKSDPGGATLGDTRAWDKQGGVLEQAPRLHGATTDFINTRPGFHGAEFNLTLTPPGAANPVVVKVTVKLVKADALTAAHAGTGGDAGPARVQLTEIANAPLDGPHHDAIIELDETLLPENVPFVLGHELDEIADVVATGNVASYAVQSEAGIYVEGKHRRPGAAVTSHDRATAREYVNMLGDLLEKRGLLDELLDKQQRGRKLSADETRRLAALQAEVPRREASERALRASMGLDAPENRAAKNEVIRESMQGHPEAGRMQQRLNFDAWIDQTGTGELRRYVGGLPSNAPPTVMNAEAVGHLKVPAPQTTPGQFITGGVYGGHETQGLEAFVANNPNFWIVLDKVKVGADGVEYRHYTQYMWHPNAGPPPPRPAGFKVGDPVPADPNWIVSAVPKTTTADLHKMMAKADRDLAAFVAGGNAIPTGQPFAVGTDPPIVLVFFGNPRVLETCFPDRTWF